MAAVGGSIESISIRGRLLPVAADADVALKLGGFSNEVKANGNGTARIIKTRIIPGANGLKVEIDHDRGDLQFLKEISDGQKFEQIALTLASGHVYQGQAIVSGDFDLSTMDTVAEVNLSGTGEFTLQ